MRDSSNLRNRILAALGFAIPACAAPPPATPAAAMDAAATETAAQADAAGSAETAASADTGPGTDAATGTDAPTIDTLGRADVAVRADAPGPVDASVPVDAAATSDAKDAGPAPLDAAANAKPDALVDAVSPADAGPADVASVDASAADGAGLCTFGQATQVCYSAEQLKANIENPPFGGDGTPKKYDGPLPPDGCPHVEFVKNSCCNAAVGQPLLQGDKCCYWYCTGACCGRPLVVDGETRVAALVASADWLGVHAAQMPMPVQEPTLTSAQVAALADAWRRDGLDEHAAIASFQRFGLELAACGAPADLVRAAATAVRDEVGHAELCFGVAQRLDGRALGPGALDLRGMTVRDLAEAAAAAVREGCVGETLAAAQAAATARTTRDAGLRAALRAVAEDEANHAELAWRFVAWAWRQGEPAVQSAVRTAFADATREPPYDPGRDTGLAGVPDSARMAWGRLPAGGADRIAAAVLAEVVRPCAARLLAGEAATTPDAPALLPKVRPQDLADVA